MLINPKKVLILTPFFPPNIGGVETFCENLFKELSKKYDTRVCTIDWGKQKTFKGIGLWQFLDVFPRLFTRFIIRLEAGKVDIVHAQGFNAAFIGALCKKAYRYKLYVTTHTLYDFKTKGRFFKYAAKKILNSADKIFVEGDTVKQDILTLGIAKDKLIKYQHWCDQEVFKPKSVGRQFYNAPNFNKEAQGSTNTKQLVVLCAGRLNMAEKGLFIIKEVERQLQGKEIKFIYAQNIPHEDMPNYFKMVDLVVVPSLYSESFPIVVIEAASCGCAVITSNRGSLPELVKDFGVALSEPYTERIRDLLLHWQMYPFYMKEMQDKALAYAREHFSPKNAEVFL